MSSRLNEAWMKGYIEGYKRITGRIPSMPARPGDAPTGIVDPVAYFYQLGFTKGQVAAR